MDLSSARFFLAGGAGFIGSHLVDRLVQHGPVTVYDNLSVGRREFLGPHLASGACRLVEADLLELDALAAMVRGHDVVFHLAANPEARWGLTNPRLDLEQGTLVTFNVLEAVRRARVPWLVFSSSGTVYGDTAAPCAEGDLGRLPISLYGASTVRVLKTPTGRTSTSSSVIMTFTPREAKVSMAASMYSFLG